MALGLTQPLTGVFPGGEGDGCIRLTTLPPSCDVVTKSGNLNALELSGPVMRLLYLYIVQSLKPTQSIRMCNEVKNPTNLGR